MKKKLALVTGGAGFIGSHLVDLLLKKNFRVIVVDNLSGGHKKNFYGHHKNKNFKFINKDINNLKKEDLKIKKLDFTFHFAGKGDIVPSIENPLNYMMTNVIGTTKVLENCRNQKIAQPFQPGLCVCKDYDLEPEFHPEKALPKQQGYNNARPET